MLANNFATCYSNAKAMKRRVNGQICHREPGVVRAGAEGTVEHGLGAAYRSICAKATTGAPVTVIDYR